MKTLLIALPVIVSALVFAGCAGKSNNKEAAQYTCSMHPEVVQDHPGLCPICKMDLTKKESVNQSRMEMVSVTSNMPADTPVVKASFVKLNAEVDAHIKNVLGYYMHIKDALVHNNTPEVKNGAALLNGIIRQFDDSYFPAKQKMEYDKHKTAIEEQAQQIISSTEIETQRGRFAELSNHVYELVKIFSTGQKIYHNRCEMAFDKNGAIWLNETAEIKNPYMGSKMMGCGSVEEVLN